MLLPHTSTLQLAGQQDDHLLRRARAGDQQAFEDLVERHGPWLLHLIRHFVHDEYLAQDVLQQVWLQLYRSLPTLRLEGKLKAWLTCVARSRCIDELRHQRILTFSDLAGKAQEHPLGTLPDPAPRPEELLEREELQHSLRAAIEILPARMRAVVLLRSMEQLSYGEIGQVLHISVPAAKTIFLRAKQRLRTSQQLAGAQETGLVG
ncbi:MAG TPA: RNA polymerase sigma factor [Ktedonobacteraceae bacterium]|jgi:RNA polymerase sigma-70 factor (ECF subfamily)